MAAVVIAAGTVQPVTAPIGLPVTLSAACTLGLSAATAAAGPSLAAGTITWPASPDGGLTPGTSTLYLASAAGATVTYAA